MSSVDPGPSKLGFPSQAVRLSVHLQNTHSDEQGENGQKPESGVDSHLWHSRRCPSPSPTGSCLKIMAVSRRQRFVRILNQSPEETVDLGGFVLQQLVLDFPVCLYRFPPSTLLAPRHHVTVLSEHQSPHCVTPVSRIFADNTDLSIDCFPLSEARPGADLAEHQPQPRPLRKGRAPPPPIQRPSGSAPRQVCRKRVDRGCPMVALSVQSTAESRFGFRFLSCPPITADTRWPL
ncbi:hypothetical protein MJG53_017110 [Ovis ammon polii x Ovis aries]|uniref:LTD domain-containing protein n=3 Tax=Ovis TaxID=9935 RepID=A0A836CV79_SHEEP|nr:hypothetical protein JEQ12_011422 [Ovis aries]KAI4530304.1 hypothetical protein MG293_020160 [Ovis ammon polii]KAI4553510.1 hypothetical protein MJT46_016804 [Ovis ammon polii x Ovis aries]KAI4562056.1 hypothetical protein MJG53_017110 [Ovis ammon polii x Ovis aries]